jgi:hypothetical protein
MKRIMMMVALAAFMVAALSVSAVTAFAESAGERACEDPAVGGTWTGEKGQWECVLPAEEEDFTKGNPPEDNPHNEPFVEEEQTTKPQRGQGVGGGAKDPEQTETCVYGPSGKLVEDESDATCEPRQ